jgi:PTS system ascorbate-specific IIB component
LNYDKKEVITIYVVTVCGMGFGTSLMLLMFIKEIAKKHGIEVNGEAVDLGSYKGKKCNFIAASSEIARQIQADNIPVVAIDNLLNKKEIEEKILPYLKK